MVFRATTTFFLVALQAVGVFAGQAADDPPEINVNKLKRRPSIEPECEDGMLPLKMDLRTDWMGFPRIQVQLLNEDLNRPMYNGFGSYDEVMFAPFEQYTLPSEDTLMCLKPDRCYKFSIKDYEFSDEVELPDFFFPSEPRNEDVERKRDSYRNLDEEEKVSDEGRLIGYALFTDPFASSMHYLFEASTNWDARGHFIYCTSGPKAKYVESRSSFGILCQDTQDKIVRGKKCKDLLRRNSKRKCQKEINGFVIADDCALTCGRREGIGPCAFLKKKGGRPKPGGKMSSMSMINMKPMNQGRRRKRVSA